MSETCAEVAAERDEYLEICNTFLQERNKLRSTLAEAISVLTRITKVYEDNNEICAVCKTGSFGDPHKPDCPMLAAYEFVTNQGEQA